MRNVKILGAAFFTVLAFGAISVASASARQWLKNGASIPVAKEPAVTEGKWTILGLGIFGIAEIEIECNGKLNGTVGPLAKDEVTSVTDLAGNIKVEDCSIMRQSSEVCLNTSMLKFPAALVEGEQTPWTTELLEPNRGEIADDFLAGAGKIPSFKVECELATKKFTEELCEGAVKTDPLKNVVGGVESQVLNAPSSKCNKGANSTRLSAKGITKLTGGGALTVS